MTLSLVIAIVVPAGSAGVLWYRSTHGLLATRAKRRVLVTLKTGEAFSGVLYASDRDCLVLRDATAIGFARDATNVPVEGEALILRGDVAYMQLP